MRADKILGNGGILLCNFVHFYFATNRQEKVPPFLKPR